MSTSSKGLAEFIAEANEILESLGRELLQLDSRRGQEADPDQINAIFRGAHSLKGLAGMFGMDQIAALAHSAEDLLDRLRLGKVALSDEVLDALIESLDVFQALLTESSRDETIAPQSTSRASHMSQRLQTLSHGGTAKAEEDPLDRVGLEAEVRNVFTEYEEHRLRENVRKGVGLWKVRAAFDLSDFDKGLAELNGRLKKVGEVISTLPSSQPGDDTGIAFDLIFGTGQGEAALSALLQGLPATVSSIPVRGSGPSAPASAPVDDWAPLAVIAPPVPAMEAKPTKAKAPRSRKAKAPKATPLDFDSPTIPPLMPTEDPRPAFVEVPAPPKRSTRPAPEPRPTAEPPRAAGSTPPLPPAEPPRAPGSIPPLPPAEPPRAAGSLPPLPAVEPPRSEPSVPPLPPAESPRARREAETSLRSLTQTVRVDIHRLDTLMNTVGDLLLIRGNLARLAEAARQGGAGGTPSKVWGQELHRETRVLERKLDELQKGLLEARMVPLGQVFDKLARMVRRVAREAGKEIDFIVRGEEVELDKLIVEELSDPLMHIIRNAIDHGVEAPEVRVRKGKPRRAKLLLKASQKGNHVVIDVSDDGAGIDTRRVRAVALERGLLTEKDAMEREDRELQYLIFLPGFSTAKNVSTLSGRGVGLDVVKTNIAHLSGMIDVSSELGKGTTFTLTLPVTLAIIRALVVSVSGRPYAVPLNSVIEITSVAANELRTVEGMEVLSLRGQTLPFARLARVFGHPERPLKRLFVVVVGLAQERLGIAVDELLGQQDIVVKPLGGRLSRVRGVSGATDLGNRRTVLVLDVGALMEEIISSDRRAEYH